MLARRGVEVDVASDLTTAARLLLHVTYSAAVVDLSAGEALLDEIALTDASLLSRTIALTTRAVERKPLRVPVLRKPFEIADIDAAFEHALASAPPSEATFERDFTRRSIAAGAKTGVAARLAAGSGVQLEHVTSFGYTPETLSEWFPIPAEAELPMCAAVRRSRPIFLPTIPSAAAAYPSLAPILEEHHSHALAAVPVQRRGRIVGVLGWSFSDSQSFDDHEQEMLAGMADSFADELE
jgi:GAF domain-containing protein